MTLTGQNQYGIQAADGMACVAKSEEEAICALGNWKNHGLFVPLAI